MLATEIDLLSEKAVIVVPRGRLDRVVLRRVALHDRVIRVLAGQPDQQPGSGG